MDTQVRPAVVVQELVSTKVLTGVPPSGVGMVDSQETLFKGRYRKYEQCDACGEVSVGDKKGGSIISVSWNLPGITAFNLYRQDDDSVLYLVHNSTAVSGSYLPENRVFIPPTWKIIAKATGALTENGRVMFVLAGGWNQTVPSQISTIGQQQRPPTMQRP